MIVVIANACQPLEARIEHLRGYLFDVLAQVGRKVPLTHVVVEADVELVRGFVIEQPSLGRAVGDRLQDGELLLGDLAVLDLGWDGACEILLNSDLHGIIFIIFLVFFFDVFVVRIPGTNHQLRVHI